ncbi:MAG TPA: DUF4249 family protein [Melioribacteraceae bacterium]|nr:DUF4249 family protein [Melioribacteraceae bacterium]
MKTLILYLSLIVCLFTVSCENEVSPTEEYKEKFIFYSILNSDADKQFATVVKSSRTMAGGSQYIKGAEIALYWDNNAAFFRDSVFTYFGKEILDSDKRAYYIRNFPFPLNKQMEIEVLLPDGKRLLAETTTPDTVSFPKKFNPIIPYEESSLITFNWVPADKNLFIVPKLTFVYYKKINGVFTIQDELEVPITYYEKNTVFTPIYPLPQKQTAISYEKAALTRKIASISKGEPNSNDFAIGVFAKFSLQIYDKNLSSYFSSTNQQVGGYQVSLEQSEFSNIKGGFGLFGSYVTQVKKLILDEDYLKQFGYSILFNEVD